MFSGDYQTTYEPFSSNGENGFIELLRFFLISASVNFYTHDIIL